MAPVAIRLYLKRRTNRCLKKGEKKENPEVILTHQKKITNFTRSKTKREVKLMKQKAKELKTGRNL